MRIMITLLALFVSQAQATGYDNPLQPILRFKCEAAVTGESKPAGPLDVHTSGRDNTLEGSLRDDAKIISDIAAELELATPHHKIYFVPDEQLNIMASVGGQPIPHWTDGFTITTSMGKVMGVMEFVTPGCPTCRSFYSDKTSRIPQRSTIMHVMGHNDMSATAEIINQRQTDAPADGLRLAQAIEEAYRLYDHDEVSQFVQHLNSFEYLQDLTSAAVELPERFAIDPAAQNRAAKSTTKWSRTANGLQALTHQLDASAPQWKRDILVLFERVNRMLPAYANSKIMNEGWATMMEYIVGRHAPWRTSQDIIEYAATMSGVAYPSLDNPYWVGLMGWYNMYNQFTRRKEIKDLSPMEQDKRFIAWARQTYRAQTDYEWLQMVIDKEFTDRWKLFLYRKTQPHEMAPGIEPEKQKFIALSRDPVRIRQYMIRKHADRSLQIPRMYLLNPAENDPSQLHFVFDDVHDLALEPVSAFKTAFVLSQVFQKRVMVTAPISPFQAIDIRAIVLNHMLHDPMWIDFDKEQIAEWVKQMPENQIWSFALQNEIVDEEDLLHPIPVKMEVDVSGDARAWGTDAANGSYDLEDLADLGRQAISAYKLDQITSLDPRMAAWQEKKWRQLAAKASDHVSDPSMEIVQYAPYAGRAVEEMIQLMEWRLPQMFKRALQSGNVTPGGSGVRLKVMPEIPKFGFDMQWYGHLQSNKAVGPVDSKYEAKQPEWGIDDNQTVLSASNYLPGDRFPGPKPGEGKGQGQGEGEGEEGDEEADGEATDNEGREPKPGGGGQNSTDVEIPLALYGEMLANELELPNIRRTEGGSDEVRRIRHGKIHKPNGNLLWHEIAVEAMHIATAVRKNKGLPHGAGVSPYDLIREGMKYIDQSNYVVSGHIDKPKPDFDAVLVVNLDVTGSMMGERVKMAKNLVFNIKALLAAKYKRVKIHYVAFDQTAEEVSEKRIWTIWKGGGTAYAPALIEDQKILERYSNGKYNKYVLTIGDGETGDGEQYVQELDKMSKDLQYAGLAIVTNGSWGGYEAFLNQVTGFRDSWPWIGTTVMTAQEQIMDAIKDLFPKGGKPGSQEKK